MLGLPGFDLQAIQRDVDGFRTDLSAIRGLLEKLVAIEEGKK